MKKKKTIAVDPSDSRRRAMDLVLGVTVGDWVIVHEEPHRVMALESDAAVGVLLVGVSRSGKRVRVPWWICRRHEVNKNVRRSSRGS